MVSPTSQGKRAARAYCCDVRADTGPWSGPRVIPTAIVVASPDVGAAQTVQTLFHGPAVPGLHRPDILGVNLRVREEFIAISAGVTTPRFVTIPRPRWVTRSLAEMRRSRGAGAQASVHGLERFGRFDGDVLFQLSRNRGLGERLGRGEKVAAIVSARGVAEGYQRRVRLRTARSFRL